MADLSVNIRKESIQTSQSGSGHKTPGRSQVLETIRRDQAHSPLRGVGGSEMKKLTHNGERRKEGMKMKKNSAKIIDQNYNLDNQKVDNLMLVHYNY